MKVCRFRYRPPNFNINMDKNSIAKAAQLLETKEDLLNLLNQRAHFKKGHILNPV